VAGVAGRVRFAEDAAFESYNCVGGEDDGGAYGTGCGEFGFGVGKALDELAGGFAGYGSLIDGGSDDDEGDAGIVENFGAPRRSGSKDEFHDCEFVLERRFRNIGIANATATIPMGAAIFSRSRTSSCFLS
jgi:hypothetical protein